MKIISTLLGLALVAVSAAAFHLWREVESGRQQIAALTLSVQQRQAQPAASSAPAVLPAVIATAAAPVAAATETESTPAPVPTAAAIPLPDMAALRAQMSSPEGLARRRQSARALMENSYVDINEAMGLTPAETDKLLDLLTTHQENMSAVFNSAVEGNSPQQRAAALRNVQQSNDAELQAMLGSRYPKYQDYRETMSVWQQRRDLRAVLDAAGAPLTQAQSGALIVALAAEQRSINQEVRAAAGQGRPSADNMTRYAPDKRQRLLDAASTQLSPQQLEGYKGMLERAAAQEQSILAPVRAMEAKAAAGSAR